MIEAIKYFFYFLLSIQIKHIVNATLYIVCAHFHSWLLLCSPNMAAVGVLYMY